MLPLLVEFLGRKRSVLYNGLEVCWQSESFDSSPNVFDTNIAPTVLLLEGSLVLFAADGNEVQVTAHRGSNEVASDSGESA